MSRFLPVIAAFLIICSGCASVEETNYFEAEDLMAVQHNDYNDYLLLVYRDPLGQTRHVLRRFGITEIVLTYTIEGDILLKARGKKERTIKAAEAGHITQRINSLLNAKEHGKARVAARKFNHRIPVIGFEFRVSSSGLIAPSTLKPTRNLQPTRNGLVIGFEFRVISTIQPVTNPKPETRNPEQPDDLIIWL